MCPKSWKDQEQQVQRPWVCLTVEDLAVVLVKSSCTRAAAENAFKLIHPTKGFVLTLQNGLGNKEIIAEVVGDDTRVLQGVTSNASYIVESGHVWQTGLGNTALAFNPKTSSQIKEIAEMLMAAGFPCELTDNLESMLWGKLIVNAGINPLTGEFDNLKTLNYYSYFTR
jgi:2-dehydropantoate 2-reductase